MTEKEITEKLEYLLQHVITPSNGNRIYYVDADYPDDLTLLLHAVVRHFGGSKMILDGKDADAKYTRLAGLGWLGCRFSEERTWLHPEKRYVISLCYRNKIDDGVPGLDDIYAVLKTMKPETLIALMSDSGYGAKNEICSHSGLCPYYYPCLHNCDRCDYGF